MFEIVLEFRVGFGKIKAGLGMARAASPHCSDYLFIPCAYSSIRNSDF